MAARGDIQRYFATEKRQRVTRRKTVGDDNGNTKAASSAAPRKAKVTTEGVSASSNKTVTVVGKRNTARKAKTVTVLAKSKPGKRATAKSTSTSGGSSLLERAMSTPRASAPALPFRVRMKRLREGGSKRAGSASSLRSARRARAAEQRPTSAATTPAKPAYSSPALAAAAALLSSRGAKRHRVSTAGASSSVLVERDTDLLSRFRAAEAKREAAAKVKAALPSAASLLNERLPPHYKLLASMFCSLDEALLVWRKKAWCLQELAAYVRNKLHRNFERVHLARIVGVYPQAYLVQVKRSTGAGASGWDLFLQIVGSKTRTQRARHFEDRLATFMDKYHTEFVRARGLAMPKTRLYHPAFDFLNAPLPPEGELPRVQKATGASRGGVQDTLKHALKAQEDFVSLFSSGDASGDGTVVSTQAVPASSSSPAFQDPELRAMIARAQAQSNKRRDPARVAARKRFNWRHSLGWIVNFIAGTFGSRKTSVPLRTMVQDLLRAKSTQAGGRRVTTAEQMREHVEKIVEVVPEWLKIAKVGGVQYLVRRRKMQPRAIREQVADHFDALEADV